MSEAVAVADAPAVEVKPLGSLESVAEFRARRTEGDTGEPVAAAKPTATDLNPEAATTAGSPVEPDPASEAGKALAAKKGSLQARIDEYTARIRESERRETALRAELEAAKAGRVAEQPKAPVVDPNDPEPDQNSFDDYAKFVKAQARWEARQELREYNARVGQAEQARSNATAQERVSAAAKAAHPDFDTTIDEFAQAGHRFSPATAEAILNHPLGHELAYALAKDPAANARLNAAPNLYVAGIEVGKILAGLTVPVVAAVVAAPAVSKAPEPVKPVTGATSASGKTDPKNMNSVAEFRKRRAEFDK